MVGKRSSGSDLEEQPLAPSLLLVMVLWRSRAKPVGDGCMRKGKMKRPLHFKSLYF